MQHGLAVARSCSAILAPLVVATLLQACGGADQRSDAALASTPALTRNVASLHAALQRELGQAVPSLSVLIDTPAGAYFTTAAAPGSTVVMPDTNFRFASNTKNFAAASVMKMHQDGWLRYTDLVTAPMPGSQQPYLPDTAAWAVPHKQNITIRQLLQHSAGVFDVGNDPVPGCAADAYEDCQLAKDPAHQFSAEELVWQVTRNGLSYFAPGQSFHYSNTGYSMLAEIVARVYSQRSGQPRTWADYVRDHLTGPGTPQPLDVRFPDDGRDQVLPEPRACGRTLLPNAPPLVTCDINISAKVAEGNGIGTMRQLNRWVRSVHSGRNVLSAATVALMHDDTSAANRAYGLGTLNFPNLGYGHNGATHGNLSLIAYDPATDVSVVVYVPMWDLSDGFTSFVKVFNALNCAGWRAREAFGYAGQPASAACPS